MRAWLIAGGLLLASCGRSEAPKIAPASGQTASAADAARNAAFWKDLAGVHFTEDRAHAGEPMPDAALIGADGRPTTLAALRGRPLLVNFWAHWCVPCRAEMPTIDRMVEERRGTLRVAAVNEDARQPSSKSLGALPMHAAIVRLTDRDGALAKTVAAGGLPTTVLYGSDGREKWRLTGVLDWTKPQARKLLDEAA